jgi:DNA-directed RNA polymerase specialized sigma24 family protein
LALLLAGVFLDVADATGIALIVIGAGVFLIGVLLPLISEFQVGPGGFSAKFRERDREFEAALNSEQMQLARLGAWLAGDPHSGKQLAEQALRDTYLRWPDARTDPGNAVRRHLVSLAPERPGVATATTTSPEGTAETPTALPSILAALPKERRGALVLHLLEDLSVEDVSRVIGRTPEEVAADIDRGLTELSSGIAHARDGGP